MAASPASSASSASASAACAPRRLRSEEPRDFELNPPARRVISRPLDQQRRLRLKVHGRQDSLGRLSVNAPSWRTVSDEMPLRRVSCVSSCIVSSPWPEAFARHVRVLINPANDALSGPLRSSFPRGGPVPVPPPPEGAATTGLGWHLFGRIWRDFSTEQKHAVMDDLLYPEQAVHVRLQPPSTCGCSAASSTCDGSLPYGCSLPHVGLPRLWPGAGGRRHGARRGHRQAAGGAAGHAGARGAR